MSRTDALMWLVGEIGSDNWPQSMDRFVTGRLAGNWRFVDTLPDNEIMFCNMMEPGITKIELAAMELSLFGERVIH